MGKILTNSQGKVITAGGNTFEITAAVDSNIQQGNIKKDVEILGVTGTYEGGDKPVIQEKDVNFYDYEGTLLYSYTKSEFANLSAMPANPTHEGLTAQGWNWSLSDAKTYVASYGKLIIGQMYITSDGKTRLYITLDSADRLSPTLYWSQSVANGVTINWGDGSAEETFSGTGNKNTTHTYSAAGDYVISLEVTSGAMGVGNYYNNPVLAGMPCYKSCVKHIRFGSDTTALTTYALYQLFCLESITIPDTLTSFSILCLAECFNLSFLVMPSGAVFQNSNGTNFIRDCISLKSISLPKLTNTNNSGWFYQCYSFCRITIPTGVVSMSSSFQKCYALTDIFIPDGVTTIGESCFSDCMSLKSVTIPDGVSIIKSSAFFGCYSLAQIIIPSSIEKIEGTVFYGCSSLKTVVVKATTPPTLSNSNAFSSIASDAQIVVPTESVEDYKAASQWSSLSSIIIGGAENY